MTAPATPENSDVSADGAASAPPAGRDEEIVDAELVADPVVSSSGGPHLAFDYTDDGVPTLDYLRSKVEGRLGTAQGSAELAESAAARSEADRANRRAQEESRRAVEEQTRAAREAQREQAAADRLAEIRKSLGH